MIVKRHGYVPSPGEASNITIEGVLNSLDSSIILVDDCQNIIYLI